MLRSGNISHYDINPGALIPRYGLFLGGQINQNLLCPPLFLFACERCELIITLRKISKKFYLSIYVREYEVNALPPFYLL